MTLEKKITIATLNKHKTAGETYTTKLAPPYPGKWRLIGRVENPDPAEKKFTFTSKVGGKLDYVLMYLRERNADTPKDICTPMDAYKEAILKK